VARVLVVEDKPENLDLMAYLLRAFGHQPLVAHDGVEGLAAAHELHPDIVVMDLQMPRMDGYQAARAFKGDPELCHIPLLAVSAYAMVGDREKVLASGFDGYLTKPIDPETFVKDVERLLERSSQHAAGDTPA
jgi:CheY-like chemotaxis protein